MKFEAYEDYENYEEYEEWEEASGGDIFYDNPYDTYDEYENNYGSLWGAAQSLCAPVNNTTSYALPLPSLSSPSCSSITLVPAVSTYDKNKNLARNSKET